jgi:ribonuclease HII
MEKDTASVVAVIICGIAMARWSGGRRAQRVAAIAIACERGDRDRVWIAMAAIVCGCDRDDKMETKINCDAYKMETKIRGDGIFQFLLHI